MRIQAMRSAHRVAAVAGFADPYTTSWPATENPISQGGGIWTQGGTTGLDWQDIQSEAGSPGTVYSTATAGDGAHFNDCVGLIQGRFNPVRHYIRAIYRRDAGYTPPNGQEVELLLGGTIIANSIKLYELDILFGGPDLARWNGPIDSFADMKANITSGGVGGPLSDGDDVRGEFTIVAGNPSISMFVNTAPYVTFVDTSGGKIVSGSPGIGFFARAGSGLDLKKVAWRNIEMGSLP